MDGYLSERMKAGREHRVPLSDADLAILRERPTRSGDESGPHVPVNSETRSAPQRHDADKVAPKYRSGRSCDRAWIQDQRSRTWCIGADGDSPWAVGRGGAWPTRWAIRPNRPTPGPICLSVAAL